MKKKLKLKSTIKNYSPVRNRLSLKNHDNSSSVFQLTAANCTCVNRHSLSLKSLFVCFHSVYFHVSMFFFSASHYDSWLTESKTTLLRNSNQCAMFSIVLPTKASQVQDHPISEGAQYWWSPS